VCSTCRDLGIESWRCPCSNEAWTHADPGLDAAEKAVAFINEKANSYANGSRCDKIHLRSIVPGSGQYGAHTERDHIGGNWYFQVRWSGWCAPLDVPHVRTRWRR
jgi:hypothetical protein